MSFHVMLIILFTMTKHLFLRPRIFKRDWVGWLFDIFEEFLTISRENIMSKVAWHSPPYSASQPPPEQSQRQRALNKEDTDEIPSAPRPRGCSPGRSRNEDRRSHHHSGHCQGEAPGGRDHRRRARRPRRGRQAGDPRRQGRRPHPVRQVVRHRGEDRRRRPPHHAGVRRLGHHRRQGCGRKAA